MSTVSLNPNEVVRVKPTASGWRQIRDFLQRRYDTCTAKGWHIDRDMPKADADGYICGQYWWLMRYFDWDSGLGSESPFYDMIIGSSDTGTGDKIPTIVQLALCNGGAEVVGETCDSIVESGDWYNVFIKGCLVAGYRASQVSCVDRSLV